MAAQTDFFKKLPDLWFDWYARFLPGIFGLLTFLIIYLKDLDLKDLAYLKLPVLLLLLLIAYIIGHIIQPISSFIVKRIEFCYHNEKKYIKAKQDKKVSRLLLKKVSKAHAEANSMLSCFFMTLINLIYYYTSKSGFSIILLCFLIFFILFTFERTSARNRKINEL